MNRTQFLVTTSMVASVVAAQPTLAQEATAQTAASAPDQPSEDPQAASSSEQPANEGQAVQEIVVTAERRLSTSQRTAAALSVRSGQDMLRQGRHTLRNILEDVPGVTGGAAENVPTSQGSGTDNPAAGLVIRGIPSNTGAGGSTTSTAAAAAIYVDDVYNGIGGAYDIDQVEILRGPQGTLYGRSATAGVVAIRTGKLSTTKFGGHAAGEIGNYDLRHWTGAVNVPLIDEKLAVRVSGNRFSRDGYDATEGDARSTTEFRAKLLWTPTDNLSALLGYAQQYNVTNSGGLSISQGNSPTDFVFTPTELAPSGKNHFRQYWANIDWDLGPVAITYIPAYRTWNQNATIFVRAAGFSADQTLRTPKDNFLTQEVRIRSTDSNSNFKWQGGLLYYKNTLREVNNLFNNLAGIFVFQSDTDKSTTAAGVFAEGTYSFGPATRLTAGIRYDHTKIDVSQDYTSILGITKSLAGDEGQRKFNNLNYKVRLEQDLTPRNLLYASISTGFSPGDVTLTTDATLQPVVETLDAQTLTAYEIGSKNRFLDNRLQVNGAVFYYDYGAFQTAAINTSPDPVNATFKTVAVPLKSYGAELEVEARPWENGTISLNASYTHARFGDLGENAIFFSTKTVTGVAPYKAAVAYDHRIPIGNTTLMLRGAVRYASAHDSSRITQAMAALGGAPYVRVPSKTVADLNGTLLLENNLSITGYVRNVTNERFLPDSWNVSAVLPGPVLGGPPVVLSDGRALSDPRTFGVIVGFKF